MSSADERPRVIVMTPHELRVIVREEVRAAVEHLEQRANEAPSEWLDAAGASELLGVHRDTLRRLRVPVHHVGRRVRYRRSDLVDWMRAGGARKGA